MDNRHGGRHTPFCDKPPSTEQYRSMTSMHQNSKRLLTDTQVHRQTDPQTYKDIPIYASKSCLQDFNKLLNDKRSMRWNHIHKRTV